MDLARRIEELLRRHSEFARNTSGCIICKRSPHTTTFLPEKLSPELLRLIGVIHGDGNMSFSRVLISDKDLRYHKDVLHPMFYSLFGSRLNLFFDKKRNTYYSHIKNKVIYAFLTEVLELPRGAVREGLEIPSYVCNASQKLKNEYIAGLFDSEGHVKKNQVEIDFSTTSKLVFDFIVNNLKDIKFGTSVRSRHKNKEYEIYITHKENVKKFCKRIMVKHPAKVARLESYSLIY